MGGGLQGWTSPYWGPLTGNSERLAGDPERYVEKALEMGISFQRGPIWGTWRRAHLLGTLREG